MFFQTGNAVVQVQLENGKSDLTFEITDLAGNKCSTANDYNKQELFVSGTTGNKNNWLEEKDGKIVLKALKQGSKMQELFWTMDFQIASGYTAKLQEKKSEGFQYKRVRDQKYLARKR